MRRAGRQSARAPARRHQAALAGLHQHPAASGPGWPRGAGGTPVIPQAPRSSCAGTVRWGKLQPVEQAHRVGQARPDEIGGGWASPLAAPSPCGPGSSAAAKWVGSTGARVVRDSLVARAAAEFAPAPAGGGIDPGLEEHLGGGAIGAGPVAAASRGPTGRAPLAAAAGPQIHRHSGRQGHRHSAGRGGCPPPAPAPDVPGHPGVGRRAIAQSIQPVHQRDEADHQRQSRPRAATVASDVRRSWPWRRQGGRPVGSSDNPSTRRPQTRHLQGRFTRWPAGRRLARPGPGTLRHRHRHATAAGAGRLNFLSPRLQDLWVTLNHGKARHAFPVRSPGCAWRRCRGPTRWVDGSAYHEHVRRVRRARGALERGRPGRAADVPGRQRRFSRPLRMTRTCEPGPGHRLRGQDRGGHRRPPDGRRGRRGRWTACGC